MGSTVHRPACEASACLANMLAYCEHWYGRGKQEKVSPLKVQAYAVVTDNAVYMSGYREGVACMLGSSLKETKYYIFNYNVPLS